MSDIVERLRSPEHNRPICLEAAATIERLREALEMAAARLWALGFHRSAEEACAALEQETGNG